MTLSEVRYLIGGCLFIHELTDASVSAELKRYGLTLAHPEELPESAERVRELSAASIYYIVGGSTRPDAEYEIRVAKCAQGWPERHQNSRAFLEAKYKLGKRGKLEFGKMPAQLFQDYRRWFFALRARARNPSPRTVVVNGVNTAAARVVEFLKSDAPVFVQKPAGSKSFTYDVPQATWVRPPLLAGLTTTHAGGS